MELLKLLSTSEIFAQVVSFLLLLLCLRVFAWKRFLKLLDDRKAKIASEFRRIEEAKAQAQGLRSDYEGRLLRIEEERRIKIAEALNEGRRLGEEMKAKAQKESERIFQDAKENIRIEALKAREDLKDSIVDISISVAEKILQERMSEKEDKKLAMEFLKGMGPAK